MNALRALLIVLLLAIIGCDSVRSVNQVGEHTYPLVAEEWNGTWLSGDDSLILEVKDSKTGEFEIMYIEYGEVEKHTAFARQTGNDSYINLVHKEEFYFFAKFKKSNNQLIIWLPLAKEIKLAIENKQLDGTIESDSDLIIKSDKSNLNKYFMVNRGKMLFQYEEPMVFRRLNN